MRDRPFITAGESPRPYSELMAERRMHDPRERALEEIAELEDQAREAARDAATVDEARALQCEAEGLRCALSELQQRGQP